MSKKLSFVIILILSILVIILFSLLISSNQKLKEKEGILECKYFCDIDLNDVPCASNYDCETLNMICDLNINKCIEANINLIGMKMVGSKELCERVNGEWILIEK